MNFKEHNEMMKERNKGIENKHVITFESGNKFDFGKLCARDLIELRDRLNKIIKN